jgi:oligo-1,6-glucosidase
MHYPEDIREQALAAEAAGADDVEAEHLEWWQEASVYQVLVPSFKDSNGDGRGDIGGVVDNLDYLVDLGVDIIWLTPVFESPMFDMGYELSITQWRPSLRKVQV